MLRMHAGKTPLVRLGTDSAVETGAPSLSSEQGSDPGSTNAGLVEVTERAAEEGGTTMEEEMEEVRDPVLDRDERAESAMVGRYRLNTIDTRWFQHVKLKCEMIRLQTLLSNPTCATTPWRRWPQPRRMRWSRAGNGSTAAAAAACSPSSRRRTPSSPRR
jgi:hypothetical protein